MLDLLVNQSPHRGKKVSSYLFNSYLVPFSKKKKKKILIQFILLVKASFLSDIRDGENFPPHSIHPTHWRLHVKKKKYILLYIKFKNFMIFLPLKKCVTTLNFFKLNIIKLQTKFSNKLTQLQTKATTSLDIFLMDTNFDKSTIRLHFVFLYPPCLQNFKKIRDQ